MKLEEAATMATIFCGTLGYSAPRLEAIDYRGELWRCLCGVDKATPSGGGIQLLEIFIGEGRVMGFRKVSKGQTKDTD